MRSIHQRRNTFGFAKPYPFMGFLLILLNLVSPLVSSAASTTHTQRVTSIELTPHARRAIDRALSYLEREQRPDGSWGKDRYWVANTALSTMAFMVQGHVPGKGKYGENLEKGVGYLVGQANKREDGYIVDSSSGTFYQHALAVMALAEAWGQSKNPKVGPAVRAGTQVILNSQNKEGGWGYSPNPKLPGDLSITIMGIEALVSAKEAGVLVPDNALERARAFIHACQSQQTGAFWYKPSRTDETNAYRMGAGLLGLQLAGELDSRALDSGWEFLMGEGVEKGWAFKERHDWLDQFYCVKACYQSGDKHIQFWYPRAAEKIISRQEPSGKIGGDGNMPHGGTAVATLVLAVPYRFLPIFQR